MGFPSVFYIIDQAALESELMWDSLLYSWISLVNRGLLLAYSRALGEQSYVGKTAEYWEKGGRVKEEA